MTDREDTPQVAPSIMVPLSLYELKATLYLFEKSNKYIARNSDKTSAKDKLIAGYLKAERMERLRQK